MFKFAVKLKDRQLIGLGFSEGNFTKLKQDKPIMIKYSALGIPLLGGIVVLYPSEESKRLDGEISEQWGLVRLNDDSMDQMRTGRFFRFQAKEFVEVILFWGADEDAMRTTMNEFIGPKTEDRSPHISDGQHRTRIQ